MVYYINSIFTFDRVSTDIRELVPDMNTRRRMSRFVKMGVSTAIESLNNFANSVDAIITSTPLGCIADSEKFLNAIIENNEQMINPTPFIQSTFNTVGAQIGLITRNNCYNMTYSHLYISFESAVLDALLRINLGESNNVLVGSIDEVTDTQKILFERLKISNGEFYEGSIFFVISREKGDNTVAKLEMVAGDCIDSGSLKVSESIYNMSFSASAFLFNEAVNIVQQGEKDSLLLINDMAPKESFRLKISRL